MFSRKKFTDQTLIKAIRAGGRPGDQAISYLLEHELGKVKHLVLRRNGSEADAEDVFMEGLTALIMNIRKEKFRGESAVSTYLFAICKGIWHKRFRKSVREGEVKDQLVVAEEDHHTPEISLMDSEQKQLLLDLFARLREKCSEVLLQWANGFSMQEIAEQLGYGNGQVVMNKKNKCLKQLHQLMESNPAVQKMVGDLYAY